MAVKCGSIFAEESLYCRNISYFKSAAYILGFNAYKWRISEYNLAYLITIKILINKVVRKISEFRGQFTRNTA